MLKTVLTKIWEFIKKIFKGFTVKDFLYIGIIVVAGFFAWKFYNSLKTDMVNAQVEFKLLKDDLARASNEMVTKKDLQAFAKSIGADMGTIQKDLKDLGASIKAVGVTVAEIKGKLESNLPSDGTTPHGDPEQPASCSFCDLHKYTLAIQMKNLTLGEMPIGLVYFDASSAAPWTLQYDTIGVKVKTVVGEMDKTGLLVFYHTISLTNNTRSELKDKEYPLTVISSEYKQVASKVTQFYLWAPHLNLAFDNMFKFSGDAYTFGGSLDFSTSGYGRSKNDLDWKFLQVGLGINSNEKPYVKLEPVFWNLKGIIPLISDFWVGVGVFYDSAFGIALSIGTTL